MIQESLPAASDAALRLLNTDDEILYALDATTQDQWPMDQRDLYAIRQWETRRILEEFCEHHWTMKYPDRVLGSTSALVLGLFGLVEWAGCVPIGNMNPLFLMTLWVFASCSLAALVVAYLEPRCPEWDVTTIGHHTVSTAIPEPLAYRMQHLATLIASPTFYVYQLGSHRLLSVGQSNGLLNRRVAIGYWRSAKLSAAMPRERA